MSNFFRKIRGTLLNEGKTTKYFKYAIGEILLVIVGILLAIQINNWNINEDNSKIEKQLLISLQNDFQKTKQNITRTLQRQTNVVNLSKALMKHYVNKNIELKKDSISAMLISGASSFWRIEPINGTYQSMLSSGDTKLLKNKKLLQSLTEYNGEINYGFEDHEVCINLILKIIDDLGNHPYLAIQPKLYDPNYITSQANSKKLKTELQMLYKNSSLFVNIDNKVDFEANRLQWQNTMLSLVNNILVDLDNELKKINK